VAMLAFPPGQTKSLLMSREPIHFAALAILCLLEISTFAGAQTSGSGSSSAAPGSAPGGGGAAPAPMLGPSPTLPTTPPGIGPPPAAPPPINGPLKTSDGRDLNDALTSPKPRQSRLRNPRKPREPSTVGSGSLAPESPARPDCFLTPPIVKEPASGEVEIATPPISPSTGRPVTKGPRC
jgi:hypothetical protein